MSYYGPQEDSNTILLEKTFLAGQFVQGVGYGAQFVVYIICVRCLWRERKRRGGVMLFLLFYITLLLGLSSLVVALGAWTIENVYINNRNYPGGPWMYYTMTQNLPQNVTYYVAIFLSTFISDFLILWRCWVIWNSSGSRPLARAIVFFPVIILLASFAIGLMWCLQSIIPGISPYRSLTNMLGIAYTAISFSVNILVTILIILRLGLHRRAILQTLPEDYANQYLSIAAIFVESAALYSAFALPSLISYALQNPIAQVFVPMVSPAQQIAGYLIIIRVAQGSAWSTDTAETTTTVQLSTVQMVAITTSSSSQIPPSSDKSGEC